MSTGPDDLETQARKLPVKLKLALAEPTKERRMMMFCLQKSTWIMVVYNE